MAVVTAICTGIAIILTFALPGEYTATVVILPPQGDSWMSARLASELAGVGGAVTGMAGNLPGTMSTNDMYVSMFKSRSVEDAVIERYRLQSEYRKKCLADVRKVLEERTEIDGSTKDGLIRLHFSDRDPDRATQVANGYLDVFRNLSQRLAITEASQRRVVFENQLEKTKVDLENADEALKRTQLSTGLLEADGQTRAMIESASQLRAQIVSQAVQIETMRSYAGDDNPVLTRAQTELEGFRSRFKKLVAPSGDLLVNDVFVQKGAVPQAGLDIARRVRDVRYYESIFQVLAKQLELAKLDEAREGAFIQVIDPAVRPERKSFPKRSEFTIDGFAVGIALGMVFALLQESLARIHRNPATNRKISLLKMSLWSGSKQKNLDAKVRVLEHAQSEPPG